MDDSPGPHISDTGGYDRHRVTRFEAALFDTGFDVDNCVLLSDVADTRQVNALFLVEPKVLLLPDQSPDAVQLLALLLLQLSCVEPP